MMQPDEFDALLIAASFGIVFLLLGALCGWF
jgi:hypothetical protein